MCKILKDKVDEISVSKYRQNSKKTRIFDEISENINEVNKCEKENRYEFEYQINCLRKFLQK